MYFGIADTIEDPYEYFFKVAVDSTVLFDRKEFFSQWSVVSVRCLARTPVTVTICRLKEYPPFPEFTK